jgi:hypothetical protein
MPPISRPLLSLALTLVLSLSCVSFAFAQTTLNPLTNADIVTMVRAKLPAALIVQKINTSPCAFDTFPSVLAELKYKGVPDDVLMAMVRAPHGARPSPTVRESGSRGSSPTVREGSTSSVDADVLSEITIPEGTPLEVESTFNVSSGEVEEGSAVSFTVVHPVKINGVTVIASGARATARVTKAKKGGSWGRAGTLAWAMQDVVAVDGSRVPLEFTKSKRGDSKGGTVATAVIVTGVLFWPAAPFWGFKKGKDAKVPAGSRFDVTMHGSTTVQAKVGAQAMTSN